MESMCETEPRSWEKKRETARVDGIIRWEILVLPVYA